MVKRVDGRTRPIVVEGEILPTITVDCSTWQAEVPPNKTSARFAIVHGNILEPIAEIESSIPLGDRFAMLVHAQKNHDIISAGTNFLRLYDSLNGFDRALGGAGWKLESTHRDNGTLTLTLAPVDPIGAAERVAKIVAAINQPGTIETPPELGKIEARVITPRG